MAAGKIVQSTLEECREAYATWINMVFFVSLLFSTYFDIEFVFIRLCYFTLFLVADKIVDSMILPGARIVEEP